MPTLKGPSFRVQSPPVEGAETQTWRKMIIETILGLYAAIKEPVSKHDIRKTVKNRIWILRKEKRWPFGFHNVAWIDRRILECADTKFFDPPPVILVTAGYYIPNPEIQKTRGLLDAE